MPDIMAIGLGLTAVTLAAGAARHVRAAERERAAIRAAWLDACLPLFSGAEVRIDPTGFPRLAGDYGGRRFDIRALPDMLTFRKLPALWLMVTIPAPMPVGATLDILRRPAGGETFSAFHRLPVNLAPPSGLPPDAGLRTDDPAGLPSETLLAPHLALLGNDRAKELVVSPRGVRLVWLAEEADRSRYLLFRDAEMGRTPMAPELLRPLLTRLAALATDLETGAAGAAEPGV